MKQLVYILILITIDLFASNVNSTLCVDNYTDKNCGENQIDIVDDLYLVQKNVIFDDDQDGVANLKDKCLKTPYGMEVNFEGCSCMDYDDDNDGVNNCNDKCANTPKGVEVNETGCDRCLSLDEDKDGVSDCVDKCANTPEGTKVDESGCALCSELDDDQDGVNNCDDICKMTPSGFEVDETGCALKYTLKINFDKDSAEIKNEYLPEIEKFANFMISFPQYDVEIQGHTDSDGSDEHNMHLSQRRANSVMKKIIEYGVDADRVTSVGYGETNLITTILADFLQNRRIEAVLIKKGEIDGY